MSITVRVRILNFDGKAQAKTNADRIRAMSDEELAELLENLTREVHNYGYACADSIEGEKPYPDSWLDWLRQEAEE